MARVVFSFFFVHSPLRIYVHLMRDVEKHHDAYNVGISYSRNESNAISQNIEYLFLRSDPSFASRVVRTGTQPVLPLVNLLKYGDPLIHFSRTFVEWIHSRFDSR